MQNRPQPSKSNAVIILRQTAKHEWIFELPRITEEVDDRLGEGIDWMHGNLKRAESIFRELIRKYPEHIDAYHHLALTLHKMGKTEEAFVLWEKAVTMALQFFPAYFSMERDQLEWGFVENRPFLRLYHSYGLGLMKLGRTEDALQVFENLIALNPNDNQGVRALVVSCHFALKEPDGVLSVCRQYPGDNMEQLLYGRALALFQLGKMKQAGKALDLAIQCFPLIAEELLRSKHRRPKGCSERYVTMGSKEQAYLYWEEQGRYWTETSGAIDLLRSRLPGQRDKRR
jgi:tetratricopeptide (TPR) repeat protein